MSVKTIFIMLPDTDPQWAEWVIFLAGCGWCGNFLLSALDHARTCCGVCHNPLLSTRSDEVLEILRHSLCD